MFFWIFSKLWNFIEFVFNFLSSQNFLNNFFLILKFPKFFRLLFLALLLKIFCFILRPFPQKFPLQNNDVFILKLIFTFYGDPLHFRTSLRPWDRMPCGFSFGNDYKTDYQNCYFWEKFMIYFPTIYCIASW